MSALHSQRGCWCGEKHTVAEATLLCIDHLNTVAEAEVLGPYEEEATVRPFYLLICRECGDGDLVMPFGSAAERGKWAAGHTAGTGHERWFVTESTARHDWVLQRFAADREERDL